MEEPHKEKILMNWITAMVWLVSHPEPDILECKVKWDLRSTAVNKASGCDEIPAELFTSLKEDANHQTIVLISHASKDMHKTLHSRL